MLSNCNWQLLSQQLLCCCIWNPRLIATLLQLLMPTQVHLAITPNSPNLLVPTPPTLPTNLRRFMLSLLLPNVPKLLNQLISRTTSAAQPLWPLMTLDSMIFMQLHLLHKWSWGSGSLGDQQHCIAPRACGSWQTEVGVWEDKDLQHHLKQKICSCNWLAGCDWQSLQAQWNVSKLSTSRNIQDSQMSPRSSLMSVPPISAQPPSPPPAAQLPPSMPLSRPPKKTTAHAMTTRDASWFLISRTPFGVPEYHSR